MLLGDRAFVDRDESVAFQETVAFHVLVVAGLHVGSFAVFLYWLGRKFRMSIRLDDALSSCRACVLRCRDRAASPSFARRAYGCGSPRWRLFLPQARAIELAAIAAFLRLIAKPTELRDSSFQLSLLSIGCIAGIAVPWMDRTLEPYLRGLRGWRDVTRDAAHPPHVTQFRFDLRSVASWLSIPDFLAAVHPQFAIISAGADNPYGHPSPELLQRLEDANAKIFRTDRDGAIHVLTDGEKIEISCFLPCNQRQLQSMGAKAQKPNSK